MAFPFKSQKFRILIVLNNYNADLYLSVENTFNWTMEYCNCTALTENFHLLSTSLLLYLDGEYAICINPL